MKTILNVFLIFLLITGILSVMRSCSDPKMGIDLPDGKLGNFLEKLADLLPGGFIELRKPGDSGDVEPGDSGDTTPELPPGEEDGKEDIGNGGEDDGGNEPSKKHSCDAEILTIYGQSATCISTGIAKHYECTECHLLFDAEGKEVTFGELTLPIDDDAHSSTTTLFSNEDGTHQCLCTYDISHVKEVEECDYTEVLVYDGSEHFRICGCGHKIDREDHYDDDEDSYCDACGAIMISGDGENDGSSGDNEGGNSGGSGGEEPDNPDEPQEPDEPTCEHRDLDDNYYCDNCGAEYRDSCDTQEHIDREYDGGCDHCDYKFDYKNMPGSSVDNKAFAYWFENLDLPKVGGNVEILSKFEVKTTEVNVGVLYWNDKFYGDDFTLEIENTLYLVPTKVETDFSLYKVRIKFATESYFDIYAHLITSESNHMIYLNRDALTVEICYSEEDMINLSYNTDRIYLSTGGVIPKFAIASIEVETIIEVPKYD